ncbi:MAG: DEAD/DEAH box helicase [Chitinophagales bacterium]
MAKSKTKIQKALLIDEEAFASFENPFKVMNIITAPNEPTRFKAARAILSEVNLFKKTILNSKKLNLSILSDENWQQVVNQAKTKYQNANSNESETTFVISILQKNAKDAFNILKNLDFAFYQRTLSPETERYITQKSKISKLKPIIDISIKKIEGKFRIRLAVKIGENDYKLSAFTRYGTLIRKRTEWFLLSQSDLAMLNKMSKINIDDFAYNDEAFLKNVVVKIEETHSVKRIDCFPKIEIETEPQKLVYLSEISGQFLTFTPQFNYDGFIAEGEFKAEKTAKLKGQEYLIKRNEAIETSFNTYLQSLHSDFKKQHNYSYFLKFEDAKKKDWFLKVYHELLDMDCEILGMDMMKNFRYSDRSITTKSKLVKTEGFLLFFEIEIHFGKEKVSLKEIRKSLLAGSSNIILKDNSLGVLTEEWKKQFGTVLKHGKIQDNIVEIAQWIIFSNKEFIQANKALIQVNKDWWADWQNWQNDTLAIAAPKKLKATLRPYQHKGFEWMVLLSKISAGACLADDMGLGKTLQTISFLCHLEEKDKAAKFLITCPSSLIYNWKQEIEKFAPHLEVLIYHGTNRNFEDFVQSNKQVIITGYATLRNDIEKMKVPYWDAVVLDESHSIKNINAKTTKAVYELNAKNRLALSGTPILNNTFDLYSQMNFLLPDLLGGQAFFKNEYANPIDKNGSKAKMEALNKLTAPFILRRNKTQVAKDLPPKTESIMWCTMSQEQQEAYEYIKIRIRDSIFLDIKSGGFGGSKMSILAGITKLKQVCASPSLVKDAEIVTEKSVKLERLLNELENNLKDRKVLVFSQFNSMLNLLSDELRTRGISHFHLSGKTPVEKRAEMVSEFQDESSKQRVFLLSLKAGNAGITLTAADYVFLLDPWWNTAVEQQAIDRTHRIGQEKQVFAYKMICKNSIEEKIIQLQAKKKLLSEELIKEEEGFVKQLTEEDLEFLLA